jgi:hypothetical protein
VWKRPFLDKANAFGGECDRSIHVRASVCDTRPLALRGTDIHGIRRYGNANVRVRSLQDDFAASGVLELEKETEMIQ